MKKEEIKTMLLAQLGEVGKHPFTVAMVDEMGEELEKSEIEDKEILVQSAMATLNASLNALKGVVKAAIEKADTVTVNYRGQKLLFDKESPFLK